MAKRCGCGKRLELEESQHLGTCYACRLPEHAFVVPRRFDVHAHIEQFRSALDGANMLVPEIDALINQILAVLRGHQTP
jgi:hypothetical protein